MPLKGSRGLTSYRESALAELVAQSPYIYGQTLVQAAPQYAKASEYIEPLRAKIEMWDLTHTDLLYYYDSFGSRQNNCVVTGADVELGIDSHGTFSFTLWDSPLLLDPKKLKRKIITIVSAKKYLNDPWVNLIYGYTQRVTPRREDTGMLEYTLEGVGSGSLINERIVNYSRTAKPESVVSSNPFRGDPSMEARNMYKALLVDSSVYAVDDVTIAEQLGIDTSLLDSSQVKDTLGGIVERYTAASNVYSAILQGVGAVGGIDANNRAFLRYPSTKHSGITLKSWNYIDDAQNTDLARFTSYFMGPFLYTVSWAKEDGFVNRWVSKGRTRTLIASSGTGDPSGQNVTEVCIADLDVAQKFVPTTISIRDLALMLRRTGDGTSVPERIKTLDGVIKADSFGAPVGGTAAYFSIPLKSIPETMTPMFITNLRFIQNIFPNYPYWIILYDRGNTPDNSIFWGVVKGSQGTNASRITGDVKYPWALNLNDPGGWEVHPNSYSFMFSVFDAFTHAIISEDTDSQDAYGIVEDSLDLQWAPSTDIINRFMTETVTSTALPKITYEANTVTIPNDLFLPGQIISIQDEMADLPSNKSITADILSVHYPFGGGSNSGAGNLGCLFLDIQPIGSYDFRQEFDFDNG